MKRQIFLFAFFIFCNNILSQKIIKQDDKYVNDAIRDILISAKKGNAEDLFCVGISCLNGNGFFEKDSKIAWEYLKKSKEGNYAAAYEKYGDYSNNWHDAKYNYEMAIKSYNPDDKFPVDTVFIRDKIESYSLGTIDNNSISDYYKVEQCFWSGDYNTCALYGDSLWQATDIITNAFQASALIYSALATQELMFNNAQLTQTLGASVKKNIKLEYAGDYIDEIIIDSERALSDKKYLSNILKFLYLSWERRKITGRNTYDLLKEVHDKLFPLAYDNSLTRDERLQLLNFEILYQDIQKDYSKDLGKIVSCFDSIVVNSSSENYIAKTKIAAQYFRLSEILNYLSVERGKKEYYELSLNTILNSRDFFNYIQKDNSAPMTLRTWRQVQSLLKGKELILVYFSLSSKNYAWIFDKNDKDFRLVYMGHTYTAEHDAVNTIVFDLYNEYSQYEKFWVIETSNLAFTDYTNDPRIIRLHSASHINDNVCNNRTPDVLAIGNINYTISTDRKLVKELLEAEEEINTLAEILGSKLAIVQGNNFNKTTLNRCNSSIIHISTHGKFDENKLVKLNESNLEDGVNGNNILKSCGLMLSGYNDDPNQNFLSAYDIRKLDLQDVDLVLLSACESAKGRVLPNGNFSLAESFYFAGVRNIIAFIDEIQENVAANFTRAFYEFLIYDKESYHDAFYHAKNQECPYYRIILLE